MIVMLMMMLITSDNWLCPRSCILCCKPVCSRYSWQRFGFEPFFGFGLQQLSSYLGSLKWPKKSILTVGLSYRLCRAEFFSSIFAWNLESLGFRFSFCPFWSNVGVFSSSFLEVNHHYSFDCYVTVRMWQMFSYVQFFSTLSIVYNTIHSIYIYLLLNT